LYKQNPGNVTSTAAKNVEKGRKITSDQQARSGAINHTGRKKR
jgi:hypothetical protein